MVGEGAAICMIEASTLRSEVRLESWAGLESFD